MNVGDTVRITTDVGGDSLNKTGVIEQIRRPKGCLTEYHVALTDGSDTLTLAEDEFEVIFAVIEENPRLLSAEAVAKYIERLADKQIEKGEEAGPLVKSAASAILAILERDFTNPQVLAALRKVRKAYDLTDEKGTTQ